MIPVCLYLSTHYSDTDTRHVATPKREFGSKPDWCRERRWDKTSGNGAPIAGSWSTPKKVYKPTFDAGQGHVPSFHPRDMKWRGTSKPQSGEVPKDNWGQVILLRESGKMVQMILQAVNCQSLERGQQKLGKRFRSGSQFQQRHGKRIELPDWNQSPIKQPVADGGVRDKC